MELSLCLKYWRESCDRKRENWRSKKKRQTYIDEGLLRVKDKDAQKFVQFFMKNAESSLQTASLLQQISDEEAIKNTLKVSKDFEFYLWVIVSSSLFNVLRCNSPTCQSMH